MTFVSVPGLKGKVFVPQKQQQSLKKHPCKDCFNCQMCGEDRCDICLKQIECRCKPLSNK